MLIQYSFVAFFISFLNTYFTYYLNTTNFIFYYHNHYQQFQIVPNLQYQYSIVFYKEIVQVNLFVGLLSLEASCTYLCIILKYFSYYLYDCDVCLNILPRFSHNQRNQLVHFYCYQDYCKKRLHSTMVIEAISNSFVSLI